MTRIAAINASKDGLLTVSVDLTPGDTNLALIVNEERAPGRFVGTPYGWLYSHPTPTEHWGYPLGFGPWSASIRWETGGALTTGSVGKPPSTLGTGRMTPQQILPLLWDAGFRTEPLLLGCLAIAAGESGFWPRARNWTPQDGFRPPGTVIGVEGPSAAWNADHSQQGHSDRGLFQINSKAWPQIPDVDCDVPAVACRTIWSMSRSGTWFQPWGHGAGFAFYEPYWDGVKAGIGPLRPVVQAWLVDRS